MKLISYLLTEDVSKDNSLIIFEVSKTVRHVLIGKYDGHEVVSNKIFLGFIENLVPQTYIKKNKWYQRDEPKRLYLGNTLPVLSKNEARDIWDILITKKFKTVGGELPK